MNLYSVIIWVLAIGAALFLFLSVRSETDQMMYALIGLALWGLAYLLNRYKKKKEG